MAEKKGLFHRLTMGKDNLPDFTPDKLPGTRIGLFKDIFLGRIGTMAKVNMLIILFALPAIAVLVLSYVSKVADAAMVPYSSSFGIGYPITPDAVNVGQARTFMFNMQMYLMLIPCIVVLFIGLAGAFNVMRRLAWGEGVTIAAHFFRGIKNNFLPFLFSSLFLGISFALAMINITGYRFLDFEPWLKILVMAVSVIVFIVLISMTLFITTQAVTYKLKLPALIKNSFLFTVGLLPMNIVILAISLIPSVLAVFMLSVPFVGMLFLMVFLMLGFSFTALVWTVYAHWVFDRFINDKIPGAVKNRGLYVVSEEEKRAKKEKELLAKNTRFRNPAYINKQISSIDEGKSFTPLGASFSRADLDRMEEEKTEMKKEIDMEFGESAETPVAIKKPASAAAQKNNTKNNANQNNTAAQKEKPQSGTDIDYTPLKNSKSKARFTKK